MKNKAQGLSLKTIIIAIVALIVLVVLWAIFTGKIGSFGKGVEDKEAATSAFEAEIRGKMGLTSTTGCVTKSGATCAFTEMGITRSECSKIGCQHDSRWINKCGGKNTPNCAAETDSGKCNGLYGDVCEWKG